MKIVVYHAHYGCDTGCCGHVVQIVSGVTMEDRFDWAEEQFRFDHPYRDETHLDFAKRLVKQTHGEKHVADLDWENCEIIDD